LRGGKKGDDVFKRKKGKRDCMERKKKPEAGKRIMFPKALYGKDMRNITSTEKGV